MLPEICEEGGGRFEYELIYPSLLFDVCRFVKTDLHKGKVDNTFVGDIGCIEGIFDCIEGGWIGKNPLQYFDLVKVHSCKVDFLQVFCSQLIANHRTFEQPHYELLFLVLQKRSQIL